MKKYIIEHRRCLFTIEQVLLCWISPLWDVTFYHLRATKNGWMLLIRTIRLSQCWIGGGFIVDDEEKRIENFSQVFGLSYWMDMIPFAEIKGAREDKKP